jgi:Uma2 family endonuclease
MSLPLPEADGTYSREAYRAWCAQQPKGRYEREDGRIVAMAPERVGHVRVKTAVHQALARAVARAGLACEALADGVTVETGDSDYEPDALVNCGARIEDDAIAAPNPVIVVEVLSPGTQSTDTGAKLVGYFQVPSVAHYLIVDPTRPRIIHHRRSAAGIDTRIVASGDIAMDPPGIVIKMEEFYGA